MGRFDHREVDMRGDGRSWDARRTHGSKGFTLPELLIVLGMVSILLSMGWSGVARLRASSALHAASRQVSAMLSLARRQAVDRRETVRFTVTGADFTLTASDGAVLARLPLEGSDALAVDSARIRPATLRFNPRGQAAPGSVYLYRGRRSIRIVCNFLGRLRIESAQVTS